MISQTISFETQVWQENKAVIKRLFIKEQLQEYRAGSFGRSGFAIAPRDQGRRVGVYYLHNGFASIVLYRQLASEQLERYRQVLLTDAYIDVELQGPVCDDGWPFLEVWVR